MLAVLRSPEGLFCCERDRTGAVVRRPLPQKPLAQGSRAQESLHAAWLALAHFTIGNTDDEQALRLVFRETSPVSSGWRTLPPRKTATAPEPNKATAAHPRAFRGTKHQPPAAPSAAMDLRPHLDRWDSVRRIAALGEPHPYAVKRWGEPFRIDALHPALREALPVVEGDIATVKRIDRNIRACPTLRPLLWRPHSSGIALLDWMDALALIPEGPQALIVALLTVLPESDSGLGEALLRLHHGHLEQAPRWLAAMHRGASSLYAISGLELEAAFTEHRAQDGFTWPWHLDRPGRTDAIPLVDALLERLPPNAQTPDGIKALYRTIGLPGAVKYLRFCLNHRLDEAPFAPAALNELILFPGALCAVGAEHWQHYEAFVPDLLKVLGALAPAQRPATLRRFRELLRLSEFPGIPSAQRLFDLAVAAPGLPSAVVCGEYRVSGTPLPECPSLFAAIEKEASTRRAQNLLYPGLDALLQVLPEWTTDQLVAHPRRLLRLAKHLGLLAPARIFRALHNASKLSLWVPPTNTAQLLRDHDLIKACCPSVLPATLRAHLAGTRLLRQTQLARALQNIQHRWSEVRIALIRSAADDELASAIDLPDTPKHRDALVHLARAQSHRRSLRRMLQRWEEAPMALLEHPESKRWLDAHPNLDRKLWIQGLRIAHSLPEGDVSLAIEQDPFEALRLGQFAQSCFAPGGILDDQPAAVVLDINKRVVYARTSEGKVIGRQILALSEDETLVCFPVYPALHSTEATASRDELFAEYNRLFSEALGLPIEQNDDYEVACILSQHFWDDGTWDRHR